MWKDYRRLTRPSMDTPPRPYPTSIVFPDGRPRDGSPGGELRRLKGSERFSNYLDKNESTLCKPFLSCMHDRKQSSGVEPLTRPGKRHVPDHPVGPQILPTGSPHRGRGTPQPCLHSWTAAPSIGSVRSGSAAAVPRQLPRHQSAPQGREPGGELRLKGSERFSNYFDKNESTMCTPPSVMHACMTENGPPALNH